jgi:hypothetical protein
MQTATKPKLRPVPKARIASSESERLKVELKRANQEYQQYGRLFRQAKDRREQLLARLLEGVDGAELVDLDEVQI